MEEKSLSNIYTYSFVIEKSYRDKSFHFGIIYAESKEDFAYKFYERENEHYDFTVGLINNINGEKKYQKILNEGILDSVISEPDSDRYFAKTLQQIKKKINKSLNDEQLEHIDYLFEESYCGPEGIFDLFKNNKIPLNILSDYIFLTDIYNLKIFKNNKSQKKKLFYLS